MEVGRDPRRREDTSMIEGGPLDEYVASAAS